MMRSVAKGWGEVGEEGLTGVGLNWMALFPASMLLSRMNFMANHLPWSCRGKELSY